MLKDIQDLLFTHNCVIIPNFGALLANYEPAELRLQDNIIFPPSKLIAFNSSLNKNDGLLIHAVKHQRNISYQEAEAMVNDFAKNCQQLLTENKSLIFDGIGKFKLDSENNIQFQPYHTINYNLNSYGLPKLSIHPVQRLKENESTIKENYQRKLHPELTSSLFENKPNHFNKMWIGLAAVCFLFLTFISFIGFNLNSKQTQQSQSSLLPDFHKIKIQKNTKVDTELKVEINHEIEDRLSDNDKKESLVVPVEKSTIQKNKLANYITIGTFFDEKRAMKLKEEAEAKGFYVKIMKDNLNGLYRTTVITEINDSEAALKRVKADINPRARIFCYSCKY